jgi:hypothetical protein
VWRKHARSVQGRDVIDRQVEDRKRERVRSAAGERRWETARPAKIAKSAEAEAALGGGLELLFRVGVGERVQSVARG